MTAASSRLRVLHVSAHYPPDFISGGTLVPARLASALRARGHDVQVFAGHIGSGREPLEQWDDIVDGVPVRWISTRPFTGWADRGNFDNPAAAAAFAEWLLGQRFDVVHVHSLQGLGAGLLAAARASGARVVVTMHDFWWVCARQFLVNRDFTPCCLVVDCGVCRCEVDVPWLRDRDGWLRHQLAFADLVLAPSAAAARLLTANGVGGPLLRVDENGLPQPPPVEAASRPLGSPVRLLFTGGADPMKGLPVLLHAAERLRHLPGWTLTVHAPPTAPVAADGLPIVHEPPYQPSELPAVLARHDVLVLPSLMRESHSIVTREALSGGLAVVCTDTLGPEEAVHDGVNGLVVPAGDDLVLADALRRLVEEPDLLPTLRTAGLQAPLRTLDEQVRGLERRYDELVGERRRAARTPTVRRVLFVTGIEGAPLRYRVRLAAEALELLDVTCDVVHYRDTAVVELADAADAVVMYRVPATWQVLDVIERIRRRADPVPVLFDVDDLIFDESVRAEVRGIAHLPQDEAALWWQGVRRYRTTMEACDAYIGSTELLVQHAAALTGMPSHRWANGVGRLLGQASDAALAHPRRPGPVRLGYFSGTTTHDHDWAAVETAVVEVMRRFPDVQLELGGHVRPTPALDQVARRVRRLPFVAWDVLPRVLRNLDVNLAPLELGGRFNEAKSAIKWLEAALVATPTVASPSQPFQEAVQHGRNGLLAATTDDWVAHLSALVSDVSLRRRLGERARRDALMGLGPHVQGDRYLAILERARAQVAEHGHRIGNGWVAEALHEPFQPSPLEPYALASTLAAGPALRRRAGAGRRLLATVSRAPILAAVAPDRRPAGPAPAHRPAAGSPGRG